MLATSSPLERRQRKSLGAFYSPPSLVEPMVAWAVTRADQSVLDPSCGDGVFLESAARRLSDLGAGPERTASLLHAVDLNPDAARFTRDRLASELGRPFSNTRISSFFSLPPPGGLFGPTEGVDVVIGNPPYIRYQDFAGGARLEALERAAHAGVQLTRLASSWAHFVVHAAAFVRPGGRLALILPAELIHTSYAAPLREHLRRSFGEVHIVSFRQAVFPEVQEEVVLLLAAGKNGGPGRLGLAEVESCSDLADLTAVLESAEVFAPGEEPEKWLPDYAAHPGAVILDHLQDRGLLLPLGEIGKAGIGFVSGANEYFILTPEEAARWHLPEGSLRPALVRARQIPGLQLTPADVELLQSRGERCLLWLPGDRLTPAEQAYVRRGEELGYDTRYKCRVRSPWFRVPGVVTPDAFLTYMSDVVPRLCLNRAQVVSSNTLLAVRLPQIPVALRKAFVTAFYNSATLLSCERIGRSYGGGVLKLEPREADRLLVPSAALVARQKEALLKQAAQVDTALRNGREGFLDEAVEAVDAILFQGEGIARSEMAAARTSLHERRRARARPRGRKSRIVSISSHRGS
ncbi:MAG TPA: N-6 DNA methylase [Thermoanaerobaculia bacterium]|nr:N-6 DNA methylase [Thermoanaerobaculia bacterium]